MSNEQCQAEVDALAERSRWTSRARLGRQEYPSEPANVSANWVASDLLPEWVSLADRLCRHIKDLEQDITRHKMEVARLEREAADRPEAMFAGCAAETQWDAAEYLTRHMRDESRDEQPPFAPKTPSGIETGL